MQVVTELSRALALCAASDEATEIRQSYLAMSRRADRRLLRSIAATSSALAISRCAAADVITPSLTFAASTASHN